MVKKSDAKHDSTTDSGLGIVGVVFGILGVLSPLNGGIVLGIIGIIFSMKQKKKSANKWSKAGIILNWIAIILGIFATALVIIFAEQLNALAAQSGVVGY